MPSWFEYIMNTPSHHRVHHATNPRYLDKNYAGVFIIWDRLFGTFAIELDDEAPDTGSSGIWAASTSSGRRSMNGSQWPGMRGTRPG